MGAGGTAANEARPGHLVLCGRDNLGLRTLEELRRLGDEVVILAGTPGEALAAAARALDAILMHGNYRDESCLRAVGLARAGALVLAENDDVGNLHAALIAQDLNPRLRIVIRLFSEELRWRAQDLFRDCAVLDSSAIAAPGFLAAALHDDWERRLAVTGRRLTVRRRAGHEPDVLLRVARLLPPGAVREEELAELFPLGDDGADDLLCLCDDGAAAPSGIARQR